MWGQGKLLWASCEVSLSSPGDRWGRRGFFRPAVSDTLFVLGKTGVSRCGLPARKQDAVAQTDENNQRAKRTRLSVNPGRSLVLQRLRQSL